MSKALRSPTSMSITETMDGNHVVATMGHDMMKCLSIEGETEIKIRDPKGLRLISPSSVGVKLTNG